MPLVCAELLHKAWVGVDTRPHTLHKAKCLVQRQPKVVHEKGEHDSTGTRDSSATVHQHASATAQCLADERVGLFKILLHVLSCVVAGRQHEVLGGRRTGA